MRVSRRRTHDPPPPASRICWAAWAWPPCAFRQRRMDYIWLFLPSNLQVFPPEYTRRKWAHFRARSIRNCFLHTSLQRLVSDPLQAGFRLLRHPLPARTLSEVAPLLPVFRAILRLRYSDGIPSGLPRFGSAYRLDLASFSTPGELSPTAVAGEGLPALSGLTGLSLLPDALSVAFSPPIQQDSGQCSLRHTNVTGHPSKVQLSYA